MPSYYSINIALNGSHHHRINNEFWSRETAIKMLADTRARYTVLDGFACELTYWECLGHHIDA